MRTRANWEVAGWPAAGSPEGITYREGRVATEKAEMAARLKLEA